MRTRLKSLIFLFLMLSTIAQAQTPASVEVDVKGVGIKREDALQDAFRNAVGEAMGVALVSETRVENFIVIKDAIQTRTQGYIETYKIIKETPFPDRYEVQIKAKVNLSPLKADINVLARSVGGIRFLVMYDDRKISEEEKPYYEFAVQRINEHLSERKYRYIDKNRFEALKKEAMYLYQDSETNEESYAQRLGMMADAQFIILLRSVKVQSRSEAFDTRTAAQIIIEAAAYDNCTAEGLGTIVLESDWNSSRELSAAKNTGITQAIEKHMPRLLGVFNSYMGEWVNNGTPFELRFYSTGTFRDFRELRRKIVEDPNFGGQIEVVAFNNYTKLNVTFRDRPDDLAYRILDYADEIPTLRDRLLDVKLIYGRQINFAPQKTNVPELQIGTEKEKKGKN